MDRSNRLREAQGYVNMARRTVEQMTENGATIRYMPAVVHANGGSYSVSAYIAASEYLSDDIIAPAGAYLNQGDYIVVATMGARSWVDSVMPYSMYSKLAIDYSNGIIYTGNGTVPPTTVFSGGGGVSNPNTGNFETTADLIVGDDIFAGDDIYLADGLRWYPVGGTPMTDYDVNMYRSGVKEITVDDRLGTGGIVIDVQGTIKQSGVDVSISGHTHSYITSDNALAISSLRF